jgi:hypothetical protein
MVTGGLLAAPLAAKARAQPTGKRPHVGIGARASLASMARRMGIASMGLAAVGCVAEPIDTDVPFVTGVFLSSAVVVFLVCTGILVFVSRRRRRRKLAKILVALAAGLVCGAVWVLLVGTVANAAGFDAMDEPAVLVVGLVTALVAALLLSAPDSVTEVAAVSAMAIGLHSLALPVAALISFVVAGAQQSPAVSARPALTAVILRVRLAGDLSTVGLSVGGLLVGLFFVFVGDRLLRRRRRRSARARVDLGRRHTERRPSA